MLRDVLPMKVLQVDTFSAWNAQANCMGLYNAYARVGNVMQFDYRWFAKRYNAKRMNNLLIQRAKSWHPDIIHFDKCETVAGETVREIRRALPDAFLYHLYGDLRPGVQKYVKAIGPHVDMTLLYYDDDIMFRHHLDAGCRDVRMWFNGTDPSIFYPRKVKKECDVVFFGNENKAASSNTSGRRDCLRAIADANFTVRIYGKGWQQLATHGNITVHKFVDMDDFAIACSKSRISLAWNDNHVRLYTSWRRLLNSMACGTMVLTRWFPGIATVFNKGEHLAWFGDIGNCVDMVGAYLGRLNDTREEIARKGMEEVRERHTWDHRVAQILEWSSK